ncbi:MAG: metal-dependent transcriptional regulator [Chloroflexi bacterium]|nr:metal-dependent transcriptional regulator [Chloroflexota bacterium]
MKEPAANPEGVKRELTANMRHYLVTIYRLAAERFQEDVTAEDPLPTALLTEKLLMAPPAVGRMIGRLRKRGLVRHYPYRGLILTATGEREALLALRRRRIAEAFLVQELGYDWAEDAEDAMQLAEGMSERLTQRLWEQAGQPATCPRGEPIPSAEGSLPPTADFSLKQAEINASYRITRIRTDEPDRLQYIAALGLTPGVELVLLQRAPFDGPLQLKLASEFRIIGDNLARVIFVEPQP